MATAVNGAATRTALRKGSGRAVPDALMGSDVV